LSQQLPDSLPATHRKSCCWGLLLALLCWSASVSAAPSLQSLRTNQDSVGRFDKFELSAGIDAAFDNPFDFDQVHLQVAVTSPSGSVSTVDGFYFEDVRGVSLWKARFAPGETGTWKFTVVISDSTGTGDTTSGSFVCVESDSPGFVRTTGRNYLRFDDGTQYFAIGENMGWGSFADPVSDFRRWLDDLSGHGGNYIRTWMSLWGFAIEWEHLGNYSGRQHRALQLDQVLEHARQRGVYVQLVLNNHGQVSTRVNPQWDDNPYNMANGGPCRNTWDFFTDSTARKLFKRRLRYIVARWGYAPNILAWELFNEVDLTDDYGQHAGDIARWHEDMAAELVHLDVNRHLITTSLSGSVGGASSDALWRAENLDLTQTHYYDLDADAVRVQRELVQSQQQSFSKPAMIGEFGFTDAGTARTSDPDGIYLHNSLWASAFSGSLGAAAIWWWDSYVAPLDLYYHFEPLAQFFANVDLLAEDFHPRIVAAGSADAEDLLARPGIGLRRASVSAFVVAPHGEITPRALQAGRYLFGSEDNRRNPPTFSVDYAQLGEFHIDTGSSLELEPRLMVWLDEQPVLDVEAATETRYIVAIPPGPHAIRVENSGSGFIRVSNYRFANYVSIVQSFALQGERTVVGWLQNTRYNWREVSASGEPPIVQRAFVRLDELQMRGNYHVLWRDPKDGSLLRSTEVASSDGSLTLQTPAFSWDLAYEVRYVGPTTAVAPQDFALGQNFPNPFNAHTVIRYQLPYPTVVDLHVRNLLGQRVATLVLGPQAAGAGQTVFTGLDDNNTPLSSGTYFYQLTAGDFSARARMTLLK
jgi:hypothetical protein